MIRLNLWEVKKRLEMEKGRDYTITEMAEGMGLNYSGLHKAMNGKSEAIHFDTLYKMLSYFRREGLNLQLPDLITEVEAKDEGKALPPYVALAGVENRV